MVVGSMMFLRSCRDASLRVRFLDEGCVVQTVDALVKVSVELLPQGIVNFQRSTN